MPWTYQEFLARLRELPEIDLLELLEINSDDLIEKFYDKIEERENDLRHKLGLGG